MVKNAHELLNKAEELGHTFLQDLYENKMNECYKKWPHTNISPRDRNNFMNLGLKENRLRKSIENCWRCLADIQILLCH